MSNRKQFLIKDENIELLQKLTKEMKVSESNVVNIALELLFDEFDKVPDEKKQFLLKHLLRKVMVLEEEIRNELDKTNNNN